MDLCKTEWTYSKLKLNVGGGKFLSVVYMYLSKGKGIVHWMEGNDELQYGV